MLITNFASGELSPTLNGRVDLQQYYQGASRLENFEIIPTGGIKRRSGSQRLAELAGDCRLIPFILDKNRVYIIEIGNDGDETSPVNQINIWKLNNAGGITKVCTAIATPWTIAEAKEIHYAQNYDTMILVHRNHKPFMIEYKKNDEFEAGSITFDFIPDVRLDDDFDFIMIPARGVPKPVQLTTADGHFKFSYAIQDGNATRTITKDFEPGVSKVYCVADGVLYEYENSTTGWIPRGVNSTDTTIFNDTGKYPGCVAFFNNRLYFASTIESSQKIWASCTPDTNRTRYNKFTTYKTFVTVDKTVKEPDLHTFTCDINSADIDKARNQTVLRNVTVDFRTAGLLKQDITDYYISSDIIPIGTKVISCTQNTLTIGTSNIVLEAETTKRNVVCTIQLWRSASVSEASDYDYTVVSNDITTADCSFNFELASDENDAIKFLSSNRFLSVGTESTIWSIPSGINASDIQAQMQGRYGSDDIQAMAVATATIYFSQGKKGIREFYYNSEQQGFETNNIAILAEQMLTESAAIDFDYVTNPFNKLLVVRQDGSVSQMLYDKTNGVMGWNRITRTAGQIRNIAVTRGEDEHDLIFMLVYDNGKYYIEKLDMGSKVFLDSWKVYEGDNEGYTADAITYEENGVVYIGYPIKSYIKSMPVINNDPTGKKRITDLIVRFLESYMPVMRIAGLPDEKFTTITELPYSGVAKITYPGASNRDVYFELETTDTKPVNILAVNANIA